MVQTMHGKVYNYTQEELESLTNFPILPPKFKDVHLGKLLFASAKAQFKSVELRQYQVPNEKLQTHGIAAAVLGNGITLYHGEFLNLCKGLPTLLDRVDMENC